MDYDIKNGEILGAWVEMQSECLYISEITTIINKDSKQVLKVLDQIIDFRRTGGD